jgi:hypothetical protein
MLNIQAAHHCFLRGCALSGSKEYKQTMNVLSRFFSVSKNSCELNVKSLVEKDDTI